MHQSTRHRLGFFCYCAQSIFHTQFSYFQIVCLYRRFLLLPFHHNNAFSATIFFQPFRSAPNKGSNPFFVRFKESKEILVWKTDARRRCFHICKNFLLYRLSSSVLHIDKLLFFCYASYKEMGFHRVGFMPDRTCSFLFLFPKHHTNISSHWMHVW